MRPVLKKALTKAWPPGRHAFGWLESPQQAGGDLESVGRDRGAAPKAIQELVGQSTFTMTLRSRHLAPSALTDPRWREVLLC